MKKDAAAMAAWQKMHAEFARHFRAKQIRVGYHEIYNEPDMPEFFLTEPFTHYLQMYKYGARGLRQGNPDAVVGGPALAHPQNEGCCKQFTRFVAKEDLPLDFFSFHAYLQEFPFPKKLQVVRDALAVDRRFRTTQIHVNELAYTCGWQNKDSPNNFHAIAPHFFDMFKEILAATNVTLTSHAQFMESTFWDDAYGLVHRDGKRKAAFNAYKIYADMPVERNVVVADDGVDGLASSDTHRASLVLWNQTDKEQTVQVNLAGISFATGTFRLYRIDRGHASYFDGAAENLEAVEKRARVETAKLAWSGSIPGWGVVYITVGDGAADDFQSRPRTRRVADVVRVNYCYEERGTTNYAWFDRKAWVAYLGMGKESAARSLVAVTADGLPKVLDVSIAVEGPMHDPGTDSLLAVRV